MNEPLHAPKPGISGTEADFALHQAAADQDIAACEALLQTGAEPNLLSDRGRTPLHHAIDTRNLAVCECLIRGGALFSHAPPERDEAYLTPFQYALQCKWLTGVRFFLATQGGDPCAARIWQRD
jgi:ankyrin repeat protein